MNPLIQAIQHIRLTENPHPVAYTCAQTLSAGRNLNMSRGPRRDAPDAFSIGLSNAPEFADIAARAPKGRNWTFFNRGNAKCGGALVANHPALLYAAVCDIMDADEIQNGYRTAAFAWHRPQFDMFLTQTWRKARHMDAEAYIRDMARTGYTHLEVNALVSPTPFEPAAPGEFYSQFYTYYPALDQFVSSTLNRGIYPPDYLRANLAQLKSLTALGRKYGLQPGIACFEPRSVPETLFDRYPTLRGPRVDHPYRSRRPRYALTIAHPMVQAHYAELIQNLMREVPDLSYMGIATNDSGAGFEHTQSLYVGRNGGPYLIREWRTEAQIANVAGANVARFLQVILDAGREINPAFRVSLSMMPFKAEHEFILDGLKPGMDVDVPSMLVRGYDLPYRHEKYPDVAGVAGSILHTRMDAQEKPLLEALRQRGLDAQMMYSQGNGDTFGPLLGIPMPWLVAEKLRAMADLGIARAVNLCGSTPPELAPYHINREVFRAFSLDVSVDIDQVIAQQARQWAADRAEDLVSIWREINEAIVHMPPLFLWAGYGFIWNRAWARPIIPDLHAPSEAERRYYEEHMVAPANNTNLVDLGKDVLFDLFDVPYARSYVQRLDENVRPRVAHALERATALVNDRGLTDAQRAVFIDVRDRLRALQCWFFTLRSIALWVACVHTCLKTEDAGEKAALRAELDGVIEAEMASTRDLLVLWEKSAVDFMAVAEGTETAFIHGDNFGEVLKRRLDLMARYRHVEPRINADIIWKV